MPKKPGIKVLYCEECKSTREVETGIRVMYCCATKMVEVEEDAPQPQDGQPPMRISPR